MRDEAMDHDCVLCGKYSSKIFESTYFFAIYDDFPVREGHILLAPIRHIEHIDLLTHEEFDDFYVALQALIKHINGTADGYNLGFNGGEAAGQTVSHLHIHLIPRQFGDVADPHGGIRNCLPDPLTEYPDERR